jgi:acylphosphatase
VIGRKVIYEGRVQGVGFRYTAKDIARSYEVCGSVKNLPDGSVELRVSGEKSEVDGYLTELAEESPVRKLIKSIHLEIMPPEQIKGFFIER